MKEGASLSRFNVAALSRGSGEYRHNYSKSKFQFNQFAYGRFTTAAAIAGGLGACLALSFSPPTFVRKFSLFIVFFTYLLSDRCFLFKNLISYILKQILFILLFSTMPSSRYITYYVYNIFSVVFFIPFVFLFVCFGFLNSEISVICDFCVFFLQIVILCMFHCNFVSCPTAHPLFFNLVNNIKSLIEKNKKIW